jgi:hypothetical protein
MNKNATIDSFDQASVRDAVRHCDAAANGFDCAFIERKAGERQPAYTSRFDEAIVAKLLVAGCYFQFMAVRLYDAA